MLCHAIAVIDKGRLEKVTYVVVHHSKS
jgi:hypothetical protein